MLFDTPILDRLIHQAGRTKLALHVPGHKLGRLLPNELSAWLGAAAKLDLTELPGLDNFHQPDGCIKASQALAAAHYGSDGCLYSVNGSTAAIIAAVMACAMPSQTILFIGPFHLSAWRGLILADAKAVTVQTRFSPQFQVFEPPTAQLVRDALKRHPDVAAVFLTSPTYSGVVAPVQSIADVVHAHGLPLIVDEAHGAHFGLHYSMPENSVQAGADIVVHSVHKMLPGLTQTAWVHWQGDCVRVDRLADCIRLLHTTSPSYLLLASLDAAQAWLRSVGRQTITESLPRVTAFQQSVIGSLPYPTDPYRFWLATGDLTASMALQDRFDHRGMVLEYADASGALGLLPLDIRNPELTACQEVILAWRNEWPERMDNALGTALFMEGDGSEDWMTTPRQAFEASKQRIPVGQAVGAVAGQLVTPYPPGVPLLFPGQRIARAHTVAIQRLIESGYPTHGVDDDGTLSVLDNA